jgi:HlyD family secretion protein
MKKKVAAGACILVLIVAGAWYIFAGKKGAVQFKTAPVTSGAIRATVTATGTVNPVVTVNVGTQVSGTIKRIYANYNSAVKKGQIIAQIDPATFQAQVDQAAANLAQAQATVLGLKATARNAKRTRDRNKELVSKELIAQADFDASEAVWLAAEAQVSAQEAQVAQMKGALDYAETNLRYTRILSPVDGIVVTRNVDVGQTVAASFQTPTLFYIAQDLTRMQIDTNVDEADIGRAKVGQEVDFNVDAYPDTLFKGKVSQVRISPITVQNVVTYDVVIQVENKELRLKPGMTANVSIVTAVKENILRLPNSALRFRPQEKESKSTAQGGAARKGQSVWVLEKDKPKRVHVKTGVSDGTYTEAQSGDLVEGQMVITESLAKAANGAPSSLMPRARHK